MLGIRQASIAVAKRGTSQRKAASGSEGFGIRVHLCGPLFKKRFQPGRQPGMIVDHVLGFAHVLLEVEEKGVAVSLCNEFPVAPANRGTLLDVFPDRSLLSSPEQGPFANLSGLLQGRD